MAIPKLDENLTDAAIFNEITDGYRKDANFLETMKNKLCEYDSTLSDYLAEGQCAGCAAIVIYSELYERAKSSGNMLPKVNPEQLREVSNKLKNISALDIEEISERIDPIIPKYVNTLHMIFPQEFIPLREYATVIKMYEALRVADGAEE